MGTCSGPEWRQGRDFNNSAIVDFEDFLDLARVSQIISENEQAFDSLEPMETIQASFGHLMRENPMGEACKDALMLDFDRQMRVQGSDYIGRCIPPLVRPESTNQVNQRRSQNGAEIS